MNRGNGWRTSSHETTSQLFVSLTWARGDTIESMHARRFGWLPLPIDDRGAKWRLTTLVDFREGVTNVLESERVDKDWYWPDIMEDTPQRPTEVYALPATHELTIDSGGSREERLAEFVIA